MSRVTYDDVEWLAVRIAQDGHDVKLKFTRDGFLKVFHDGKEILEDGPRDYSVALAKVKSIGMHATPATIPGEMTDSSNGTPRLVTEMDVRMPRIHKKKGKSRVKSD